MRINAGTAGMGTACKARLCHCRMRILCKYKLLESRWIPPTLRKQSSLATCLSLCNKETVALSSTLSRKQSCPRTPQRNVCRCFVLCKAEFCTLEMPCRVLDSSFPAPDLNCAESAPQILRGFTGEFSLKDRGRSSEDVPSCSRKLHARRWLDLSRLHFGVSVWVFPRLSPPALQADRPIR